MERRETIQCRTDASGQRKCIRTRTILRHTPGKPPEVVSTEEEEDFGPEENDVGEDEPWGLDPLALFENFFGAFLPASPPAHAAPRTRPPPFAYSMFDRPQQDIDYDPSSSALEFRRRKRPQGSDGDEQDHAAAVRRYCLSTIYTDPNENI